MSVSISGHEPNTADVG